MATLSTPSDIGIARALRQPHLLVLWFSQLLSSIGSHLYEIAVVWFSVQTVGTGTGWVLSAGAIARLVFGLWGGVYVDRWDRRRTLIAVDLIRAATVFTLPIATVWGSITIPHLIVVAIVLGATGSLFDPALQASLPTITNDRRTLQAMNGLLDITPRIARIVGPALAGVLLVMLPVSHLFTLDGLSFAVSALALFGLAKAFSRAETAVVSSEARPSFFQEWREAVRLVRADAEVWWTLWGLAIVNVVWSIAFTVGIALFANALFNGDPRPYGLIVGAYGVGNVISNLVVSQMPIHRPALWFFVGKMVLGAGFLLLALSSTLPMALLGAAIAAVGGPMGDIPLATSIQGTFPTHHIGKIFSLRMTMSDVGGSVGLILATPLFAAMSPAFGIGVGAWVLIVLGAMGFVYFVRKDAGTAERGR